jgi:hypothetical protein
VPRHDDQQLRVAAQQRFRRNAEGYGDSDAAAVACFLGDADVETDGRTDAHADADAKTHTDADTHADANAHADADTNADRYAEA